MSKKKDKALPDDNAEQWRQFCEELATKLAGEEERAEDEERAKHVDGDEKWIAAPWEKQVMLNWKERGLAAEALRYVAQHVIGSPPKPKRGNPNLTRDFDHEFAAILFGIYSNQNMKPEAAYEKIAAHLSTADNTVDANAVRMAIKPSREEAVSLATNLHIKVRDDGAKK